MRVLVAMTYPPELEGGAAARCAVGFAGGLRAHGVSCRILTVADLDRDVDVPPGIDVDIVRAQPPSRMRPPGYRILNPGIPYRRALVARRLRAHASEADVVHFFDPAMGALMGASMGSRRKPWLAQVFCLTLRDQPQATLRTVAGRNALELLRIERRAIRRARWLVANSAEVAGALAVDAPRAEVTVVPLALDPSHYEAQASLANPVAGLIGTAKWPPTANAVRRLLTRVWPMVLARRPDARLVLAGNGMERSTFPELADVPGVEWHGSVLSAVSFLQGLGLLLYPLSAGSGTKVKVLESMALGLPVVTTPDGAEGLGARGGVVVETDDERIALAAIELLDDVGRRRAAGAAARESFMRSHAPQAAAEPAVRLYERMLA